MSKQNARKILLPNNLMTTGTRWTSKQIKNKGLDRHHPILAMTKTTAVLIVQKTLLCIGKVMETRLNIIKAKTHTESRMVVSQTKIRM